MKKTTPSLIFTRQFVFLANKAAFSDLENGTIKNGDASKHRAELSGDAHPQHSIGDSNGNSGAGGGANDGKSSKRRRSDDFDYFQRNDLASSDINKDMFARIQRTDTITKDGKHYNSFSSTILKR